MSRSVSLSLCSRLKCVETFCICSHYILHRHSWSSEDDLWSPDFSSSTNRWLAFVLWNVSVTIRTNLVYSRSQGMNLTDFGEPLTFHPVPPAGQAFHLSSEISQNLLDGLAFFTDIYGPQMMNSADFGNFSSSTTMFIFVVLSEISINWIAISVFKLWAC